MSLDRFQSIFRSVFRDDTLVVHCDLTAKDVKGWDSFNHINLIVAIEDAYGVTFRTDEMAGAATVGNLIDILRSKGVDIAAG
ncbi:acyl carrier protein [Azospirillum sp.]|uniref:acyl carrier protein n=1 Tax=Azospirillum sp. TaxID=34012 RepID=UPI003D70EBDC